MPAKAQQPSAPRRRKLVVGGGPLGDKEEKQPNTNSGNEVAHGQCVGISTSGTASSLSDSNLASSSHSTSSSHSSDVPKLPQQQQQQQKYQQQHGLPPQPLRNNNNHRVLPTAAQPYKSHHYPLHSAASSSHTPSCSSSSQKLYYTSPRCDLDDSEIFPQQQQNERLKQHDERWKHVSEQAGSHRQDSSVLHINRRQMTPSVLKAGVPPQQAKRIRALYLRLDESEDLLPEWLDVVAQLFVHLEHLYLTKGDGSDNNKAPHDNISNAAQPSRLRRLYILYRLPHLISIDGVPVTKSERRLARPDDPNGHKVQRNEWTLETNNSSPKQSGSPKNKQQQQQHPRSPKQQQHQQQQESKSPKQQQPPKSPKQQQIPKSPKQQQQQQQLVGAQEILAKHIPKLLKKAGDNNDHIVGVGKMYPQSLNGTIQGLEQVMSETGEGYELDLELADAIQRIQMPTSPESRKNGNSPRRRPVPPTKSPQDRSPNNHQSDDDDDDEMIVHTSLSNEIISPQAKAALTNSLPHRMELQNQVPKSRPKPTSPGENQPQLLRKLPVEPDNNNNALDFEEADSTVTSAYGYGHWSGACFAPFQVCTKPKTHQHHRKLKLTVAPRENHNSKANNNDNNNNANLTFTSHQGTGTSATTIETTTYNNTHTLSSTLEENKHYPQHVQLVPKNNNNIPEDPHHRATSKGAASGGKSDSGDERKSHKYSTLVTASNQKQETRERRKLFRSDQPSASESSRRSHKYSRLIVEVNDLTTKLGGNEQQGATNEEQPQQRPWQQHQEWDDNGTMTGVSVDVNPAAGGHISVATMPTVFDNMSDSNSESDSDQENDQQGKYRNKKTTEGNLARRRNMAGVTIDIAMEDGDNRLQPVPAPRHVNKKTTARKTTEVAKKKPEWAPDTVDENDADNDDDGHHTGTDIGEPQTDPEIVELVLQKLGRALHRTSEPDHLRGRKEPACRNHNSAMEGNAARIIESITYERSKQHHMDVTRSKLKNIMKENRRKSTGGGCHGSEEIHSRGADNFYKLESRLNSLIETPGGEAVGGLPPSSIPQSPKSSQAPETDRRTLIKAASELDENLRIMLGQQPSKATNVRPTSFSPLSHKLSQLRHHGLPDQRKDLTDNLDNISTEKPRIHAAMPSAFAQGPTTGQLSVKTDMSPLTKLESSMGQLFTTIMANMALHPENDPPRIQVQPQKQKRYFPQIMEDALAVEEPPHDDDSTMFVVEISNKSVDDELTMNDLDGHAHTGHQEDHSVINLVLPSVPSQHSIIDLTDKSTVFSHTDNKIHPERYNAGNLASQQPEIINLVGQEDDASQALQRHAPQNDQLQKQQESASQLTQLSKPPLYSSKSDDQTSSEQPTDELHSQPAADDGRDAGEDSQAAELSTEMPATNVNTGGTFDIGATPSTVSHQGTKVGMVVNLPTVYEECGQGELADDESKGKIVAAAAAGAAAAANARGDDASTNAQSRMQFGCLPVGGFLGMSCNQDDETGAGTDFPSEWIPASDALTSETLKFPMSPPKEIIRTPEHPALEINLLDGEYPSEIAAFCESESANPYPKEVLVDDDDMAPSMMEGLLKAMNHSPMFDDFPSDNTEDGYNQSLPKEITAIMDTLQASPEAQFPKSPNSPDEFEPLQYDKSPGCFTDSPMSPARLALFERSPGTFSASNAHSPKLLAVLSDRDNGETGRGCDSPTPSQEFSLALPSLAVGQREESDCAAGQHVKGKPQISSSIEARTKTWLALRAKGRSQRPALSVKVAVNIDKTKGEIEVARPRTPERIPYVRFGRTHSKGASPARIRFDTDASIKPTKEDTSTEEAVAGEPNPPDMPEVSRTHLGTSFDFNVAEATKSPRHDSNPGDAGFQLATSRAATASRSLSSPFPMQFRDRLRKSAGVSSPTHHAAIPDSKNPARLNVVGNKPRHPGAVSSPVSRDSPPSPLHQRNTNQQQPENPMGTISSPVTVSRVKPVSSPLLKMSAKKKSKARTNGDLPPPCPNARQRPVPQLRTEKAKKAISMWKQQRTARSNSIMDNLEDEDECSSDEEEEPQMRDDSHN